MIVEKYQFFRKQIPEERTNLTLEELTNAIERYFDNNCKIYI